MIKVENLSKTFGRKTVLDDISFDVPTGTSLAIIGGSGTGKSVTIKCILGLIRPDKGTLTWNGTPIKSQREGFLKKFGMLFQGGALFDSMRVWQNVAFRLIHDGMDAQSARDKAIEKLARTGLNPETADLYPAELSGGMQKRVALARAIATDPDVIFFDEPTSGLDPIMSGVINRLIREIVTEMGATTITITHDMSSVRVIADTALLLHDGKIRWTGPAIAMEQQDNPYLYQFLNGLADGPIEAVR